MSYFANIEVTDNYDIGGDDFPPIPHGTKSKALIESAEWSEYEGDRYINVKWALVGGEFNDRKIFQKIRVADDNEKKRNKALTMLAAIDANAGGKIAASQKEPDDFMLMSCLTNKMMSIVLAVWAFPEEKDESGNILKEAKSGNWIKAVSSSKSANAVKSGPVDVPGFDDDIPEDF